MRGEGGGGDLSGGMGRRGGGEEALGDLAGPGEEGWAERESALIEALAGGFELRELGGGVERGGSGEGGGEGVEVFWAEVAGDVAEPVGGRIERGGEGGEALGEEGGGAGGREG